MSTEDLTPQPTMSAPPDVAATAEEQIEDHPQKTSVENQAEAVNDKPSNPTAQNQGQPQEAAKRTAITSPLQDNKNNPAKQTSSGEPDRPIKEEPGLNNKATPRTASRTEDALVDLLNGGSSSVKAPKLSTRAAPSAAKKRARAPAGQFDVDFDDDDEEDRGNEGGKTPARKKPRVRNAVYKVDLDAVSDTEDTPIQNKGQLPTLQLRSYKHFPEFLNWFGGKHNSKMAIIRAHKVAYPLKKYHNKSVDDPTDWKAKLSLGPAKDTGVITGPKDKAMHKVYESHKRLLHRGEKVMLCHPFFVEAAKSVPMSDFAVSAEQQIYLFYQMYAKDYEQALRARVPKITEEDIKKKPLRVTKHGNHKGWIPANWGQSKSWKLPSGKEKEDEAIDEED